MPSCPTITSTTNSEKADLQAPIQLPDNSDVSSSDEEEDRQNEKSPIKVSKSGRVLKKPSRLDEFELYSAYCMLSSTTEEPKTFEEARQNDEWKAAIKNELDSHKELGTWTPAKLPENKEAIDTKWVFKIKEDGTKKARLVARGFQIPYNKLEEFTYAPVCRMSTIRILISQAVIHDWPMRQIDVPTAFLNGKLESDVFIKTPKGLNCDSQILKLNRALYGLRESPKCWNDCFSKEMERFGFKRSPYDYCLYVGPDVFLCLFVDDGIITGNSSKIDAVIGALHKRFRVKDLGNVSSFLGMQFSKANGSITVVQSKMIDRILKEFKMEQCRPVSTPMDTGFQVEELKIVDRDIPYRRLGSEVELRGWRGDGRDNWKGSGNVPKWLKGEFFSVGPGIFDIGDFTMNHWCDGFGIICKFSLSENEITFTKRYLNSDAYTKAKSIGKPVYTEFGTKAYSDPTKSFFGKMLNNVIPELTDNESNNIYRLGSTVYVATESANKRTLNIKTLQSEQKVDLTSVMGVNLACSHVYFDAAGTGYTVGTSLTSGVKTQIFKIPPKECKPGTEFKGHQVLCTIPSRYRTSVSFAHSFGLAENKIVFIEQPLFMSGMKLVSATMKGNSMHDTMEWKPEEKNRFIIAEKSTGEVSQVIYESSIAFFFYHHINTYEENDKLIVDVLAHDSPEIMDKLWLKELRSGNFQLKDKSTARRYILPLIKNEKELMALPEGVNMIQGESVSAVRKGNKIIIAGRNLTEPSYDLPTISSRVAGKKYTYFYASGMYGDGTFRNSVVKVNVETGDITKWTGSTNEFAGEPHFIAAPGSCEEDDGVVLSIVADTKSRETFLLILGAQNMDEIARAIVTSHTPTLIHCLFIPK
ncbi:Hypothetical protein NTJ_04378 [Nesidiocoris tenuis]|nr:Hypothetical protein NTJ_04378 [Nesidiocoris tenuis]